MHGFPIYQFLVPLLIMAIWAACVIRVGRSRRVAGGAPRIAWTVATLLAWPLVFPLFLILVEYGPEGRRSPAARDA